MSFVITTSNTSVCLSACFAVFTGDEHSSFRSSWVLQTEWNFSHVLEIRRGKHQDVCPSTSFSIRCSLLSY